MVLRQYSKNERIEMSKIINVDFHARQREGSFEEDYTPHINAIDNDFRNLLDKICFVTHNDKEFQEDVAYIFGRIMSEIYQRNK